MKKPIDNASPYYFRSLKNRKIIIFLLLAMLPFAISARQPLPVIQVSPGIYQLRLNPYAEFLKDRNRSLNFSEIWEQWQAGMLQDTGNFVMPPKFQSGLYDYWQVFIVKNTSSDSLPLICQLRGLEDDPVWIISGAFSQYKKTAKSYFKDSLGLINFFIKSAFTYSIPPGRQDTIVCKSNIYIMPPDFHFHLSDASTYEVNYNRNNSYKQTALMLFLGCLFTIIVYSLFRYVQLREGVFIWYALYVFTLFFIGWRSFEDLNPYLISTNFYLPWTYIRVTQTALLFIAYANFVLYFLGNTPETLKRFVRVVTYISVAVILIDLLLIKIVSNHHSWLFYYWSRIFLITLIVLFLPNIKRHPHPLAGFIFWGSACLVFFEVLSWVVPNYYISVTAYVGVVLDLSIFSMAMAYRSRLAVEEREQAKAKIQRMQLEKALEAEKLRNTIAQDIHDEVGSTLTKISLEVQLATLLPGISKAELQKRLHQIGIDTRHASAQLREIVFAVNPDFDRFKVIQAYFRETADSFWSETGIEPVFEFGQTDLNPIVSPAVKQQLLFIFKEAQTNIAKHANASCVSIAFQLTDPNCYFLEIKDNGRGFVVSEGRAFSNGLSGMKKRTDRIGANISLISAPEIGTTVRIEGCLSTEEDL